MADFNNGERGRRIQQVAEEVVRRRAAGESLPDEAVVVEHPELMPELGHKLKALDAIVAVLEEPLCESHPDAPGGETPTICSTVSGRGSVYNDEEEPIPDRIGRYDVRSRLGSGGFGTVYRGHDSELRRDIAIKVPRQGRIREPDDLEAYLNEARLVAQLDHPHIVSVYDVGRTEDGRCFVVSKLIDGSDLRQKIQSRDRDYRGAAQLIATVAEALHYAHGREITHRDIKPENILIDNADQPYVADFGLAIRDEDLGKGSGYAGTPLYWSPEQARGEGHRVDGRSDIFSLGIVFYELLTGKTPFTGSSAVEIVERIENIEARPPRQLDDTIPMELEQICLKCLSKRLTDRYTTAADLAAELRDVALAKSVVNRPSAPGQRLVSEPDVGRHGGADDYFCYISHSKVDQLFAQVPDDPDQYRESYTAEDLEWLCGLSYGRPDILQKNVRLKRVYLRRLCAVLQHISSTIVPFEWATAPDSQAGLFYRYTGVFRVTRVDDEQLMVSLASEGQGRILTLHCSLEYFSEAPIKDGKPFIHSTNYAFFQGMPVTFETIFVLVSRVEDNIYGSPLFLKLSATREVLI